MDRIERTRRIVGHMTQTRHQVGLMEPEDPIVSVAAEEVAVFLKMGGKGADWTFPSMRPLEGMGMFEDSQMSESSVQVDNDRMQEDSAPAAGSMLKRSLVCRLLNVTFSFAYQSRSWMMMALPPQSVKE